MDARVSELRVVDLLDGLCAMMKSYVQIKAGPAREFWLKVEGGMPDSPEMAFNRHATELHSRAIVEFCGQLLGMTKEEVVCQELNKNCNESLETAPPAGDGENDEGVSESAEDLVEEEAEDLQRM